MDPKKEEVLKRYAERVGFSSEDLKHFSADDPRVRHLERLAEAAPRYSIVAEVVESHHCNSGHKPGDRFVLDTDGNFIGKLCPKRMCVYLISQLTIPVALINERLSEALEPNAFHFMKYVRCPDTGVGCTGYGQVMVKVGVELRGR